MKKRFPFAPWIWAFVGLLILSAGAMTLGRTGSETSPGIENYSPSGTRAFAELLRNRGYKLRQDRNPNPRIRKDEVAVAFTSPRETSLFSGEETESKLVKAFQTFVREGGRGIHLEMNPDFSEASREAAKSKTPVKLFLDGKTLHVSTSSQFSQLSDLADPYVSVWYSDEWAAHLGLFGKGKLLTIDDGIPATNRFISQHDNARIMLTAVESIAKPGDRLVFLEGEFDPSAPSLVATIGPWAEAIWYQAILCFLTFCLILGRRFGFPDSEKRVQRGSRELLDALGDTLRRGRATSAALDQALTHAALVIRRISKNNWEPEREHLNPTLPESLRTALAGCRALRTEAKPPLGATLNALAALQRELRSFAGNNRRRL